MTVKFIKGQQTKEAKMRTDRVHGFIQSRKSNKALERFRRKAYEPWRKASE